MHMRVGVALTLILIGSLLGISLVASPVSAAVLAVSTFDSSTEGWTAVTLDTAGNIAGSSASFGAGLGNPGGALRHDAPSESRTSYFSAPSPFIAALHSAVGGFVSWDIATINHTNDIYFVDWDIEIRAGANRLRRNVTPPAPPISPGYARYILGFGTSAGWLIFDGASTTTASQAQIDAVLTTADTFLIRAEYWSSMIADTGLLDNVVVAGAGPAVILNRTTAAPGDVVEMRLVPNSALGAVDLYVVIALPASLGPSLGCGNGLPIAFIFNGGSAVTLSCAANPPNTFPRYVASTTLPTATLFSLVWPPNAPPGTYIFAAVATPPGGLADNVIGPTDILALPIFVLTRF